jgi:CRISPR-associated protein Cas2
LRDGKLAASLGMEGGRYKRIVVTLKNAMLSSPSRTLYLVAYDIGNPRRLARVHRYLTGWKVGGQKSFFECWLTEAELRQVMHELRELIEPSEDRVHVFQLDPRMTPKCFGTATTSKGTQFLIM